MVFIGDSFLGIFLGNLIVHRKTLDNGMMGLVMALKQIELFGCLLFFFMGLELARWNYLDEKKETRRKNID